jgi:hypothetical protein
MTIQSKISKEMKEHIGLAYVSALDVVPEVKILATRRLLTLLSGAVKINGDTQYFKLIIDCINDCERAISEYAESEEQWAHACFLCNKILDKLTPLIYGGYGTIGSMPGFTLQNQGEQKR